MKWFWKVVPWCILAVFVADVLAVMLPKADGRFHVRGFGRLPVLLEGRVQPLDSVGRNSLLQIRSTGDVPLEEVPAWKFWHHPAKLKSSAWLLEVMTKPEVADTRPIFLIHHSDILGELKLLDKGKEKSGLHYYSFNELRPVYSQILDQGRRASAVKAEEQTSFQRQMLKLANAVQLYQRLKVSLQPEGVDDFAAELAAYEKNLGPAQAALEASEHGTNFDKQAIQRLAEPLQEFQFMSEFAYPLLVPPLQPEGAREDWQNAGNSLLKAVRTLRVHPAMTYYAAMATAYR